VYDELITSAKHQARSQSYTDWGRQNFRGIVTGKHPQLTVAITVLRVRYKTMLRAEHMQNIVWFVIFRGTLVANEVNEICQKNLLG